jgi:hypothetical protein
MCFSKQTKQDEVNAVVKTYTDDKRSINSDFINKVISPPEKDGLHYLKLQDDMVKWPERKTLNY